MYTILLICVGQIIVLLVFNNGFTLQHGKYFSGQTATNEIEVTRHIINYLPQYIEEGARMVSAISPGVLGTTGIETVEILKGIVDNIKPKLVIVIDALASRSIERISSTVQLSDTGIVPGAGVGNDTKILNQTTINIPTIALGVPMMISGFGLCEKIENNLKDKIFAPKEVDIFINKCARTISIAINLAIHGKVYKDYC